MIRKLRTRFVVITLLALTAAMVLVVGVVNFSNWITVRRELLSTVSLIAGTASWSDAAALPSGRQSDVPAPSPADDSVTPPPPPDGETPFQGGHFRGDSDLSDGRFRARERLEQDRHARNLVNESRWFSVQQDAEGSLSLVSQLRLDDLEEADCLSLAAEALSSGRSSGFISHYAFQTTVSSDESLVFFLDCETRLNAVRTLLLISALACVGGILLAWVITGLASRRAIQPTLRNMEQQKRFITDASHELKTPLTVISANMELLRMENPDNPWVRSTLKQTASLRRLVDELVYLSRLEEEHPTLMLEPLHISSLIREAAEPFEAMAEFSGIPMEIDADDALWISGDRSSVQRMFSTLFDNAAKYADPSGPIRISASGTSRQVRITVSNTVAEPLSSDQCAHLFDRFYRTDASRSKGKKAGFGIGLSIAAAVAEKHGGSISAAMEDGTRLAVTCILPRATAPDRKG